MENTKAKNVIIVVLVLLLLGIIGYFAYYVITNNNLQQAINIPNNNNIYDENISNNSNELTNEVNNEEISDTKIDIQNAVVTGVADKWNTGNEIKQTMKIVVNDKELTENVDYTVTYTNNINPGTATIKIDGLNNYQGSKEITFKIKDQYENYKNKNIKWATTSYSFGKGLDLKIYINNGKVYIDNSKATKIQITGLSGTPKKVYIPFSQALGDIKAYILTTNGDLYSIIDIYYQKKFTPKKIKTGVLDIAIGGGVVGAAGDIYILSNGKLSTLDGYTFEQINKNFVKAISINLGNVVYLDKDGYMYMDKGNYNYYKFTDFKPSQIFISENTTGNYDQPIEEYILVLGKDNKIYKIKEKYDSKYNITGYNVTNPIGKQTVSSFKFTKESVYGTNGEAQVNSLELKLKSSTEYDKTVVHSIEQYYYDVKKDKLIEATSISSKHDIYDITSYESGVFQYDGKHTLYIDKFNYVYFKTGDKEYVRLTNIKVNKIYYYDCEYYTRLLLVGDNQAIVIENLEKYNSYQYKYNLMDMPYIVEDSGSSNYKQVLSFLLSESSFALKSVYDVSLRSVIL